MAIVTMPQLGESVTEGTITQWLKQPGDPVALDEPICEIETEKVTAELPSMFEGTMGDILVQQGETVDVETPLCEIIETGAVPAETKDDADTAIAAPNAGGWSGGPMAIREDGVVPGAESEAQPEPAPV